MAKKQKKVGVYCQRYNELTNQTLPCGDVWQSSGLYQHIHKRHPGKEALLKAVPEILEQPTYVGKNPNEANSIELVKEYDENVMVCIKLSQKEQKLYVASVFEVSKAKIEKRIQSGRLKKY